MVIPIFAFLKSRSLSSHDQHALFFRIAVILIALGNRKQSDKGIFEKARDEPVIQRRRQHDHIGFPIEWINLLHIISLGTGMFCVPATPPATKATVYLHTRKMELGYLMSRLHGAFGKGCCQSGGIAVLAWTSI